MIIKLIRIKNDLLKKQRKFSKFKEILKKFFKMFIFAYYFQIIFLTNYVSGKIERHVPPQSITAKIGGGEPPRLPGAPMIKPPTDFKR